LSIGLLGLSGYSYFNFVFDGVVITVHWVPKKREPLEVIDAVFQTQIQNQFVMIMRQLVQAKKNWNRRHERQLLLGVISVCNGKKITLKLFTEVAAQHLKDRSFGELRKCFVIHDEVRVKTAKQQFV